MTSLTVTRGIPSTFVDAIVQKAPPSPIDLDAARVEHAAYVAALRAIGLRVVELPADDRFPDSCFVEDAAVVHEGTALLCRLGAASRRGEEEALRETLAPHCRIETMSAPATLEGGDVCRIGARLYVGRGPRTNEAGIARAREVFGPLGLEVIAVPLEGLFHLKCVCSYLGRNKLALTRDTIAVDTFGGAAVEPVLLPREDWPASNCVAHEGTLLTSDGFPAAHAALRAAGFEVRPLRTDQIRRADGLLTCLQLRIET